jgi:hypothetical protein
LTSDLKRTVRIRCETGPAGAEIAAQVVLAMATRASITPLAADRLRGDVASALRTCEVAVGVECATEDRAVTVAIDAPRPALERMAAALEAHGPEALDGRLVMRVRRAHLRQV